MIRKVLLLVAFNVGCGMLATPRISEIETVDNQSNRELRTAEYGSSGKIETITDTVGGTIDEVFEFGYSGANIDSITQLDDQNAVQATYSLSYEGGRLSEVSRDINGTVRVTTFDYDDDRIKEISRQTGDTTFAITTFDYDDRNRVERITEDDAGDATIQEFNYDDDDGGFGELKSVKITQGGGQPTTVGFSYEDANRKLERVSISGASQNIVYSEESGLIEEIKMQQGQNTETARFKYEDGDVEGVRPSPDILFGSFFTMEGRRIDVLDMVAYAVFGEVLF